MSSSTTAGESIYVFAGKGDNWRFLDTIEALDVSSPSSEWETIQTQNFTARSRAVVCSLSETRILICGGNSGKSLNDVHVFDTKTKKTRKVTDAPMGFENYVGSNQTYLERDGVVLAVVGIEGKG